MPQPNDDPNGPYRWVYGAALAALVVRLVGLTRPVRADEAGFTLVARAWHPAADSVYGAYFVDRPPSLIALFRLTDAIGGPLTIRVVGALACAALVLVAGRVAALLAGRAAAPYVAVAAAALVTTPVIDVVAVKGEVLALPFALAAVGLAVVAARERVAWAAFSAGLLAAVPLGLKQNLAGALVFVVVVLMTTRGARRLLVPAVVGAALPVLATVVWALTAGVELHTLWYTVYGFRADASSALGSGPPGKNLIRALVLVGIVLVSGIVAALAAYAGGLREHWRRDAPLTAAVVAMILFDVASLAAGGSFWQDYAFGLVPGTLLALTLVAARARRWLVGFTVASAVLCVAGWAVWNAAGQQEFDEHDTGVALRGVAEPGDTLVVFGGRADVQLESRLTSPYPYLWSLPMRTLDPDFTELRALIESPDAPVWLVEWWPFDSWDDGEAYGDVLRAAVEQRYVAHGTGCGDRPIWLLRGTERSVPEPECHD